MLFISREKLKNAMLGQQPKDALVLIGSKLNKTIEEWAEICETEEGITLFHPMVNEDYVPLSFDELLLDERYAEGYIFFPVKILKEAGYLNERLPEKRVYEWLLRVAGNYSVTGRKPLSWMKMESEEIEEPETGSAASYQAECYIVSKYASRLKELGYFEEVVSTLIKQARTEKDAAERIEYLERMLSQSESYRQLEDGTAPFLIYHGVTYCYNILNIFAEQLEAALLRRGERVEVYDEQKEDIEGLSRYTMQRFKAIIGIQTYLMSVYLKQSGRYLHDEIIGPKFNMVLDHPIWLKGLLQKVPHDYYILTHDENYRRFISEHYWEVTETYLFPPAGIYQGEESPYEGEKIYSVTFIATYGDYREKLEVIRGCVPKVRKIALRFLHYLKSAPFDTAEQSFELALRDLDIHPEKKVYLNMFFEMRMVVQTIMYYYREKCIQVLLDAGIVVDVWGESWKKSPLSVYPNLRIHGDVTSEESLVILQKSKLSLNVMAWHKGGFTERMANSMLSGAAVVTDQTTYAEHGLQNNNQIVMFRLEELNTLPEQIKALLADDERRIQLARNGFRYAKAYHTWDERAGQLLDIIENLRVDKKTAAVPTTIFTMTHKKFRKPDDNTYVPLHVGRANASDLGYMGDETGDSISVKNCYYGELTGVYWLWKNYRTEGNIGICHYRRFFMDDNRKVLSTADYERILTKYDIITSKALYVKTDTYRDYYSEAHNGYDLELEGEVIRELYPEDYPIFEQVMSGKKYYFGNLMVTSKQLFDEYCQWLFSIFDVLEKRIDVSSYDDYRKRVFGFLSEQLLLVWITARGLRVYESRVSIIAEKAETVEFKLAIAKLLEVGKIAEARAMFYEVLKIRPDIRLEHSDIKNEIPIMEQILYICEVEQERGQQGMYAHAHVLPSLIMHYGEIKRILANAPAWSQEDTDYLKRTNVTDTAVEVIARNQPDLQHRVEQIMSCYQKKI